MDQRLCAPVRPRAHRSCPHPVRRSDLRHNPAQAPQARRSRPGQRAARQIRARLSLSLRLRMAAWLAIGEQFQPLILVWGDAGALVEVGVSAVNKGPSPALSVSLAATVDEPNRMLQRVLPSSEEIMSKRKSSPPRRLRSPIAKSSSQCA
jgi:hypothetical protein